MSEAEFNAIQWSVRGEQPRVSGPRWAVPGLRAVPRTASPVLQSHWRTGRQAGKQAAEQACTGRHVPGRGNLYLLLVGPNLPFGLYYSI